MLQNFQLHEQDSQLLASKCCWKAETEILTLFSLLLLEKISHNNLQHGEAESTSPLVPAIKKKCKLAPRVIVGTKYYTHILSSSTQNNNFKQVGVDYMNHHSI